MSLLTASTTSLCSRWTNSVSLARMGFSWLILRCIMWCSSSLATERIRVNSESVWASEKRRRRPASEKTDVNLEVGAMFCVCVPFCQCLFETLRVRETERERKHHESLTTWRLERFSDQKRALPSFCLLVCRSGLITVIIRITLMQAPVAQRVYWAN